MISDKGSSVPAVGPSTTPRRCYYDVARRAQPRDGAEPAGTARWLDRVLDQLDQLGEPAVDDTTSDAIVTATAFRRTAAALDQRHHPQLLDRARTLLDNADELIAHIEYLVETGRDPFATANCPNCDRTLAVPRYPGRIEYGPCRSVFSRHEVFHQ